MSPLIGLLLTVLVACVVYWAVHRLAGTFELPAKIVVAIDIALVILALVAIVGLFGYGPGVRWVG